MTITELVEAAAANAKDKGWHEPVPSVGESIALMHSELSEALEEARDGKMMTTIYFETDIPDRPRGTGPLRKPEGVPIELADAVIRIADFCGLHGIDLERAIRLKMAYNRTRPQRHGKVF